MPHWKIMDNAPVIAEPTVTDANTRSGSAAAKGIAPSEIKDKPKTQADLPASRSSLLYKFFLKSLMIVPLLVAVPFLKS